MPTACRSSFECGRGKDEIGVEGVGWRVEGVGLGAAMMIGWACAIERKGGGYGFGCTPPCSPFLRGGKGWGARVSDRLGSTPPGPPFLRGERDVRGFRWSVVLRSDHWRVTPFTPPAPPLQGGERDVRGFRWSVVLRSDHWRVTPFTLPAPPLQGGERDVRGFRWSVVLRSDHWRVTPFTPPAPPLQGGERRGRGSRAWFVGWSLLPGVGGSGGRRALPVHRRGTQSSGALGRGR